MENISIFHEEIIKSISEDSALAATDSSVLGLLMGSVCVIIDSNNQFNSKDDMCSRK